MFIRWLQVHQDRTSTLQDMLQQHDTVFTEQDLTAMDDVEQYLSTMTEQNLAALLEQDTRQNMPTVTERNTTQGRQILTRDSATSVTLNDGKMPVSTSEWTGFKIVGDNIDKNFRPTYQRHDNKTISLHAFHMYALCSERQDRLFNPV